MKRVAAIDQDVDRVRSHGERTIIARHRSVVAPQTRLQDGIKMQRVERVGLRRQDFLTELLGVGQPAGIVGRNGAAKQLHRGARLRTGDAVVSHVAMPLRPRRAGSNAP
jgi:hypothetical protein